MKKCKCKKDAVIIENKKYYCANCYINKFIGVRKKLRLESNNIYSKTSNKFR